jgi:hypothetical protein
MSSNVSGVPLALGFGGVLAGLALASGRRGSRSADPLAGLKPTAPPFLGYSIAVDRADIERATTLPDELREPWMYPDFRVVMEIYLDDMRDAMETEPFAMVLEPVLMVTSQEFSTASTGEGRRAREAARRCLNNSVHAWVEQLLGRDKAPGYMLMDLVLPVGEAAPAWPAEHTHPDRGELIYNIVNEEDGSNITMPFLSGRPSALMQVYLLRVKDIISLLHMKPRSLDVLLQHAPQLKAEGAFRSRVILGGRKIWMLGDERLTPDQAAAAGLT